MVHEVVGEDVVLVVEADGLLHLCCCGFAPEGDFSTPSVSLSTRIPALLAKSGMSVGARTERRTRTEWLPPRSLRVGHKLHTRLAAPQRIRHPRMRHHLRQDPTLKRSSVHKTPIPHVKAGLVVVDCLLVVTRASLEVHDVHAGRVQHAGAVGPACCLAGWVPAAFLYALAEADAAAGGECVDWGEGLGEGAGEEEEGGCNRLVRWRRRRGSFRWCGRLWSGRRGSGDQS